MLLVHSPVHFKYKSFVSKYYVRAHNFNFETVKRQYYIVLIHITFQD